ncbi:MAG TPA: recombinase family protein [Pseudolabrys sp.]
MRYVSHSRRCCGYRCPQRPPCGYRRGFAAPRCLLAEFERELIRTRTGEGRARAVARGVRLGRKPKLTGHQRKEAIARRQAGEVLTDIARTYNVSHSTISRLH